MNSIGFVRLIATLVVVFALVACGAPETDGTVPQSPVAAPASPAAESPAAVPSPAVAPSPAAEPSPASSPSPEAEAPSTYAVGDTVELGELRVTLHEVRQVEGNAFAQPEAGNRFLVLDMTIENTGAAEANISTALQMNIRDSEGRSYPVDILATTLGGTQAPEGVVAAGDRMRGPVGYQVPVDSGPLQWVFQEPFSGDRVVFDLGEV